MSKVWILVDFRIHQEYIAKVLCINKNKPQSSCKGQCHLKKQLQQAEEKEKKQTPALLKNKAELVFIVFHIPFFSSPDSHMDKNIVFTYNESLYSTLFIKTLFKPPQFI
ncbi:hypothetical protein E9993_09585 [Labilibacter sediminis]|nr:hypothetical protein E9993_09585 [Labilibacter sediminis]